MIELLNRIESAVPLSELVKAGIVHPNIIRDRDMFLKYKALRVSGLERMEAYAELSSTFGISLIRVVQIITKMK